MATPANYKQAKFDRCDHRLLGTCDEGTEGCCAVAACAICLKILDEYGELLASDAADFDGSGYVGSVGGISFRSFRGRSQYSDDCVFTVIIDEGGYDEQFLEFAQCDDDEAVSCREPTGEAEVEYNGKPATLVWEPVETIIMKHRQTAGKACEGLDIAFVLDVTGSMEGVLADIQAEIVGIVNTITSVSSDYQLSLHSFRDTVSYDVSFALNNADTFIPALNALAAFEGGGAPEASDYALRDAVAQSGWRGSARKAIILVTNAPPGGLNDIEDQADIDRLYTAARDAGSGGKFLMTVNAGSDSHVEDILQTAADEAGGSYLPSAEGLPSAIEALIEELCPPTNCKAPFCGNCTCAVKKVCIRLTGPDCDVADVFEMDLDPYCEEQTKAVWPFSLTCEDGPTIAGEITLQREEYTDECELILSIPAEYEEQTVIVDDCLEMGAEFTIPIGYDEYTIKVSAAKCDTCDVLCCDQPETLTCTFTGNGCGCLDGVSVPLTKVSNGQGWDYHGDPGTCFPPNLMGMSILIECTPDALSECLHWVLIFGNNDGCHPHSGTYPPLEECSCEPLIMEWDVPFSGLGGCCEGGEINTLVRFTVTR